MPSFPPLEDLDVLPHLQALIEQSIGEPIEIWAVASLHDEPRLEVQLRGHRYEIRVGDTVGYHNAQHIAWQIIRSLSLSQIDVSRLPSLFANGDGLVWQRASQPSIPGLIIDDILGQKMPSDPTPPKTLWDHLMES